MKNQTYTIYCDFDGTISKKDTLDLLFDKYVDRKNLIKYATLWEQGVIGSNECLEELFCRVVINKPDLDNFIKKIRIDDHFVPFIKSLSSSITFNILSDGVDMIIYGVLKSYGVVNRINNIFCNQLTHSQGQTRVFFSSHNEKMKICQHQPKCALCKSAIIEQAHQKNTSKILYIGDGQSDYYGAMQANIVFAKSKLHDHLLKEKKNEVYIFKTFEDISNHLRSSSLNEDIFSA